MDRFVLVALVLLVSSLASIVYCWYYINKVCDHELNVVYQSGQRDKFFKTRNTAYRVIDFSIGVGMTAIVALMYEFQI